MNQPNEKVISIAAKSNAGSKSPGTLTTLWWEVVVDGAEKVTFFSVDAALEYAYDLREEGSLAQYVEYAPETGDAYGNFVIRVYEFQFARHGLCPAHCLPVSEQQRRGLPSEN